MKTIEYELKTLRYKQQILAILIFSLVTIAIWVLASLARSQRETKIAPELQAISQPLNPSINETILDQIEQKRRYSADELANFPIYRLLTDEESEARSANQPAIGPNLAAELGIPVASEAAVPNLSAPESSPATLLSPTPSPEASTPPSSL